MAMPKLRIDFLRITDDLVEAYLGQAYLGRVKFFDYADGKKSPDFVAMGSVMELGHVPTEGFDLESVALQYLVNEARKKFIVYGIKVVADVGAIHDFVGRSREQVDAYILTLNVFNYVGQERDVELLREAEAE